MPILNTVTYEYSHRRLGTRGKEKGQVSSSDRVTVGKLARAARGGLVDVSTAAGKLSLGRRATAMKLGALARRGWLLRARRGLYFVLPLEAEPGKPMVVEDPWILAREAFSPCYIGGWSAAEHWGLTEQLFRSTLVVTAAPIRSRSIKLLGHEFRLFHVPAKRTKDALLVWRGQERVPVSGRERTIVDCLRHPELCGGIRHVAHIMREYGNIPEHDFVKLAAAARDAASGSAWKRLGFLTELLWPEEKELLDQARVYLTTGYARLDPTVRKTGRLIRRWRLWMNVPIDAGESET
jgi:predicted transcriptional regulator of viral defense system